MIGVNVYVLFAGSLVSASTIRSSSVNLRGRSLMANPASIHCVDNGYELSIQTSEDGSQYGVCVFPDGSKCEEWAFYHGKCTYQGSLLGGDTPGMPNPASQYCEEQNFELSIRTDSTGGQYGVCVFPDGSECEEWALFRGECTYEGTLLGGDILDMPNPASQYCEEQGYELSIRTSSDGSQFGVCIFTDDSECDEWAFFRGECFFGAEKKCFATKAELKRVVNLYMLYPAATKKAFGAIGDLCVPQVTDFSGLFKGQRNFNEPLVGWNVSKAVNLNGMFAGALSFNQNINHFDTSNVKRMDGMFKNARAFNQPLNKWRTSNAETMAAMFDGATSFNRQIDKWDVSKVKSTRRMFRVARAFNQNISSWNLKNVNDMTEMFSQASSFNQNLCAWDDKIPKSLNHRCKLGAESVFRGTACPVTSDPFQRCHMVASTVDSWCRVCNKH